MRLSSIFRWAFSLGSRLRGSKSTSLGVTTSLTAAASLDKVLAGFGVAVAAGVGFGMTGAAVLSGCGDRESAAEEALGALTAVGEDAEAGVSATIAGGAEISAARC